MELDIERNVNFRLFHKSTFDNEVLAARIIRKRKHGAAAARYERRSFVFSVYRNGRYGIAAVGRKRYGYVSAEHGICAHLYRSVFPAPLHDVQGNTSDLIFKARIFGALCLPPGFKTYVYHGVREDTVFCARHHFHDAVLFGKHVEFAVDSRRGDAKPLLALPCGDLIGRKLNGLIVKYAPIYQRYVMNAPISVIAI